jgi:hypothetical protein
MILLAMPVEMALENQSSSSEAVPEKPLCWLCQAEAAETAAAAEQ